MGIATGNLLWSDGVRTLATITEATDYAEGVRRTTASQFAKLGGSIVAAEQYGSDNTDFRSQLSKLFAANPDAPHLAPQSEASAGDIIKQTREVGYEGPIYAETISIGTSALEVAGDAATGMKAVAADFDPNNEKGQEVLANFRERYKLHHAAMALGVRLRRRLHHRRMPATDQRRSGRRRLPGLPVRHHLERCHRRQLQL